jgi:hypothetical protein
MSPLTKHLIVFATVAFVHANALAQIDRNAAERVLQLSGTLAQISALTPQFKTNFEQGLNEQRDAPLIPAEKKRLTDVGDEAFAPSKLRTNILNTISQRLTAEHVAALEKWYESDLGKRMLAMESEAAKTEQRSAMEAGAALLAKLPEARTNVLKELVEATRSADFVADLSINMAAAAAYNTSVATAVAASRSVSTSLNEIRELAMRDRAQIAKSIGEVLLIAYAKTYETASDDDLKAYVAHMKSPANKLFADAVIVAFDRAIIASANDLGAQLSAPPKPTRR